MVVFVLELQSVIVNMVCQRENDRLVLLSASTLVHVRYLLF